MTAPYGSVGVGGGNADEQCAYQALEKVLGPQPPVTTTNPPAPGVPPSRPPPAGRDGRGWTRLSRPPAAIDLRRTLDLSKRLRNGA